MVNRDRIGEGRLILESLAGLFINYLRWTQITPLVMVWMFSLVMLLAMFFVNNQEATFGLIESTARWITDLPWLGEKIVAKMESLENEDGAISLGGHDLEAFALKVWGYMSLGFMLLALLVNWLLGPFKPWSLKKKIGLAGVSCLLLLAGFILCYFADPENFNGSIGEWMLNFSLIGLMAFVVSVWFLTISHLLGLLQRAVVSRAPDESNDLAQY